MFCSSFFVCFLCFSLKGFFEHVKVRKQQSGFTAFGPNCNVEAVDLVMVRVRKVTYLADVVQFLSMQPMRVVSMQDAIHRCSTSYEMPEVRLLHLSEL